MLNANLNISELLYGGNCIGYRIRFSKENCSDIVFDVEKEVGESYGLNNMCDDRYTLIPSGDLLVTQDELEKGILIEDCTSTPNKLEDILSEYKSLTYNNVVKDVFNVDNDECNDTNNELNRRSDELVNYLCGLYLNPSRLADMYGYMGIPVNLEIDVNNGVSKVLSEYSDASLNVEDIINSIKDKMWQEGYSYKTSDEFNNNMTDGTFLLNM